MTRSIPPWLAPVVERLELDRLSVVTIDDIERIRGQVGVEPAANRIVEHLAERGWLLRTGVHGAWEFAPADRAGPRSAGDPFLALRASLAIDPDLPVALALSSALWLLDIADRAPAKAEVAMPPGAYVPKALRREYRVVRHEGRLPPLRIQRIPVHRPATVLVHLASRPTDVRSWGGILDRLAELLEAADEADIMSELEGRAHATLVRFAYLVSGLAPDLVDRLRIRPAGKVWFGPRRTLKRHSARWNVADTILPIAPSELGSGSAP